jgi:hypothetical protein
MFEAIEAEIDDSTSFAPCGARHAAARSIEVSPAGSSPAKQTG